MSFLYKNEYRIFKLVERNHHKKGNNVKRRKMEGMNQFGIPYMCTWKYHNETPCIDILNKNVFFQKQRVGM
jgi:hypothetical protein